jgi:membrane protein DedA with SNARE-associated domain
MDDVVAVEAPSRTPLRLAWFLVPIALVFVTAQIGRAVWPSLLDSAPWSLLLVSSAFTRMLMVQPLVPTVAFFALAFGRIMVLAPLYYLFGRDYGDVGLRWTEDKLGSSSRVVGRVEHWFRRFSHLLVACWWSPLVCVMAGATAMRARVFFPLLALGTVARVTLIFFIGDALSAPITEITSFIGRYALILTPITIAITGAQLWFSRRKRGGLPAGSIEDLEDSFAATELEVASEATVVSPRQPD